MLTLRKKGVKYIMKKLIVVLVAIGFVLGVINMSEAATTVTTTKKAVVTKKVVAKKAVAKKKVVKKAVKAAPKVAPKVAPIAPPPPPVAPIAPTPVAVKAAPSAGLFGWGLNTAWTGTYLNTGKGKINGCLAASAALVVKDPFMLSGLVGLPADSLKYLVGVGGLYGNSTADGDRIKAIPVFVDGVISLPVMGMDTFIGGGLNYVVYGSGQKAGNVGGEIYVGMSQDLGLGLGKTSFELGWAAVRAYQETAKGFTLSVCQPIVL
jgi:hypothetical protein